MPINVVFGWSGGKDSAFALHKLQHDPRYHVAGLLTTVTEGYDRISMHGVRRVLLEQQAEVLGLPLEKVYIPQNSSNDDYSRRMEATLTRLQSQGVNTCAFGDLFLEDIREYRETNLAKIGMQAIFPVWQEDTHTFARSFIEMGFKAIITCVDLSQLDQSFAGRAFDDRFLAALPENVDPCGENGEFHSFVYDGPNFRHPIPFNPGELVLRNNLCFCDLLPVLQ